MKSYAFMFLALVFSAMILESAAVDLGLALLAKAIIKTKLKKKIIGKGIGFAGGALFGVALAGLVGGRNNRRGGRR